MDHFYGWYFKCQSESQTLAVIPSFHKSKAGSFCAVQLITDEASWTVCYPHSSFQKRGRSITIGENRFSPRGFSLHLQRNGLSAVGAVRFGPPTPIRYDIMGPFRYVPFLECRHSVFSMRHTVDGVLSVNGVPYTFSNGAGYMEGDRGYSFPREYAWTQCCFDGGSLMLSVAEIPLFGFRFTGIIGVILFEGREYRLATYLGARAVRIQDGTLQIRQGDMGFTAKLLAEKAQPLHAPVRGAMVRTIHESASCQASYRFQKAGKTLFSFTASNASFEYEYPS